MVFVTKHSVNKALKNLVTNNERKKFVSTFLNNDLDECLKFESHHKISQTLIPMPNGREEELLKLITG